MGRTGNKIHPELSEAQFGFLPDKGTRNVIFSLSTLLERAIEVQQNIYLCFIDYVKAFDKEKHENLINILENLDIDGKDLTIFRNLYWEQEAAVRKDNQLSDFKSIRRGVRQGCASPQIFSISIAK